MPGRSCTIERLRRTSRLKSADFPTFGRPATTTRKRPGEGLMGLALARDSPFEPQLEARMRKRVDVGELREDPACEDLLALLEDRDPRRGILRLDAGGRDRSPTHRERRKEDVGAD